MIRYLNGVLTAPVVPIATTFLAAGDHPRVRELALRGLRYCYAATVPFSVVMVVYAAPVLGSGLGTGSAAPALRPRCSAPGGWWGQSAE